MSRSYDWDAPAKLFYWPCDDGGGEETTYSNLRDAMFAVDEDRLGTAWIVTRDGDILNPRIVSALKTEQATRVAARRQRWSFRSMLARAA